jgi:hypothetical protein
MEYHHLVNHLFKRNKIKEIHNVLSQQMDIDLFFNYYMSQKDIYWGVVLLILKSGVSLNKTSEYRKDYSNYRLLFEASIEQKTFEQVSSFLIENHPDNLALLDKICINFNYHSKKALSYLKMLYQKTSTFTQNAKDCLNIIVSENHFDMLKWIYSNGFQADINLIKKPTQYCYWQNSHSCAIVDCIENKENKIFLKKLKYLESLGFIVEKNDTHLLNAVGYLDDLITYKYLEKKGVQFKNQEEKKSIITDMVMNNSVKIIQYLLSKNDILLNDFQPFDYFKYNKGLKTKYELDYLAHACIFHHKKNKYIFELLVNQGYEWKNQQKAILEYISSFTLSLVEPLLDYLFSLEIYSDDEDSILKHTDCGQAIMQYLDIKNIEKEKQQFSLYLTEKKSKLIKI